MMIAAPILILTVILVARYDEIHNTEGKGYDIKCTQSSEPSAAVGSLICTAEHSQKTNNGESDSPWWHVFFTWPEGITALLITLTLGAIIWQAWETRKAAEATQEGARATAEQSANMMALERAILSVIFPPNDPHIYDLLMEDTDGKTYQSLEVFINIINEGETRAFNVKASGYILIEPIQIGKAYASHGNEFAIPKVIRSATIDNPVRIAVCPSGFGTSIQVRSGDCVAIQTGRKPLHIVGTISYEDVFGKPHHTPFWYTWQVRTDNGNWGDEAGWTDTSGASD